LTLDEISETSRGFVNMFQIKIVTSRLCFGHLEVFLEYSKLILSCTLTISIFS